MLGVCSAVVADSGTVAEFVVGSVVVNDVPLVVGGSSEDMVIGGPCESRNGCKSCLADLEEFCVDIKFISVLGCDCERLVKCCSSV